MILLSALLATAPLKPNTTGKMVPSRLEALIDGQPSIYMRPNQPDCANDPKFYDPKLKVGDTYVTSVEAVTDAASESYKETKTIESVSPQTISEKKAQSPTASFALRTCYAIKTDGDAVMGTAAVGRFTLASGLTVDAHGIDRVTSHTTIACRDSSGTESILGKGSLHEIKIETEDLVTDLMDRCFPHTTVFNYVNAVLDDGTIVFSMKTELLSAPQP